MKNLATDNKKTIALLVHLTGRVQGVGMRPFIYRLAKDHNLYGFVYNRPDGVIVHIEGHEKDVNEFLEELSNFKHQAASIKQLTKQATDIRHLTDFEILRSRESEELITEICPDICVCPECLDELNSSERRTHYPFINCTHCGPRFTLLNDFPYDRINTTMQEFEMCPECLKEYSDPSDRRFHAQPTCCHCCGPVYKFTDRTMEITDSDLVIQKAAENIDKGKVIAIKGLGGYNLACDAFDSKAIAELRNFKNREKKPFAVMFRSIEDIEELANVGKKEYETLLSWQRPIVILKLKNNQRIDSGITSGLNTVGAFLPYLPMHFLLFEKFRTNAIILTSGNDSDTPILIDDDKALSAFKKISGGILTNNRKIARRNDDSVVRVIHSEPRLMRRARGYVPSPVDLSFDANGILATGAELSNCFCIGKGRQAILSQHIGDLKNAETYSFFCNNIKEFSRLYRFDPVKIVCDLHPDYLSTLYTRNSGLPVIQVQHHHAHIVACMAEYGINEPVIGLSYDGTGYGTDENIWGSELMIAGLSNFKRVSHFEYIPIPGGDLATKETWRSALSYLYRTFGPDWSRTNIPFLKEIDLYKAGKLTEAIDKKLNSPLCCSAGRLFDAIAALLGICFESDYHAEAPLLMENFLDDKFTHSYSFTGNEVISFAPAITEIVSDIVKKKPLGQIVTQFHNTIATAAAHQVRFAMANNPVKKLVITGGTFQNKYLTEKLIHLLDQTDLEIFLPRDVPCNDGGIALGQLAIAANRKNE